jgi:arabinogalactan endo-1,4-beta-galactosidase
MMKPFPIAARMPPAPSLLLKIKGMSAQLPSLAFFALALAAVSVFAADDSITNKNSRIGPFILGAEVSWVPEDEADGAEYFDHGVKKDIFEILKEHKFNYIRLRLFVNPASTNGYARRRAEAFCDLEHVKALARRARAAGMGLLLDIHYGDTWTSPGHQEKPVAWKEFNFQELTQAVRDFTHRAIYEMKTNGTPADMVQIGNEISDGMLFPDGRRSNWDHFAALLKAGIAGAKEADPSVKIVLHHHLGRSNERMRPWLDNLIQRGVDFDIIGMSCYAQAHEGDWKNNFDDLAGRYPDKGLLVVEYSAQKRYINDLMFNTPHAKGLGTFIWEPTRHRQALFDKDGRNAGGGQASNFTTDQGINQGARLPGTNLASSANTPANTNLFESTNRNFGTNAAAYGEFRRRRLGGRYDANELFELYPQMAKDFAGVAPARQTEPAETPAPGIPKSPATNQPHP